MKKMQKAECEAAIRHLVHKWAQETGFTPGTGETAVFGEFWLWLEKNRYSQFLNFKSVAGVRYNVETWFDQEMKQTSQN